MKHIFEKHEKCQRIHCEICDGGLAHCTVCGQAEATLAVTCPGTNQRFVVCAAIKVGETIILGARHFDKRMVAHLKELGYGEHNRCPHIDQGFIDQHGVYMGREEALKVAFDAGQINKRRPKSSPLDILFSEDLY